VTDRLVAIVPVKALAAAKSRLAPTLSPDERASLALRLLDRVLSAVTSTPGVDRCLVVSADDTVRLRARVGGAEVVDEPGDPVATGDRSDLQRQHNEALEHARRVAIERWDPAALLVVAADLPFLTSEELSGLIERGATDNTVVLGADRTGTGTNALLLRPADALPFRFGPDSLAAHRAEAFRRGLQFFVHDTHGIATDVDLPRDLEVLAR
jgi:2-phospho-L-lactate guanylyltransferase